MRPAHAQLSVPDLTATANGRTQIDLSWTAPTLPSGFVILGYGIEVSPSGTDNTWTELVADTGSSATTYSHTGLTAGTTRYYRIDYVNTNTAQIIDVTSDVASATTDAATAPDAPTGLTATANGQTRIDLSWTAPTDTGGTDITGYKIEASPSGTAGTWTTLVADTGSTGTTYPHGGLMPATTRYYQVSAINANGTSGPSNEASATTEAAGTLDAPTGLMATADGPNRIDLSWMAPSGDGTPTGYKIEASPSGADGTWTTLEFDTGGTGTTYTHTGLAPGATRHYRVSAIDATGASVPSTAASATTTTPGGGIRVEPLGGALKVSWDAVAGRSHYSLAWKSGGQSYSHRTSSGRFVNLLRSTTYTITGLTPGTKYTARMRAHQSGGGTFIAIREAAGTPGLGKVSGVTATAASGHSLQVGWNAAAGAQSYAVQWRSGAQGWSGERQATTTGRSYTITNLTAETAYTVRVQARRSGLSPGEWSDEASATTPNLTATGVANTRATLNVTGHPATWSYRHTTPSGGTCATAQGSSTTVSGLTPGEDYTFATYSDGSCMTMLASVSFTTTAAKIEDLTATAVGTSLEMRWNSAEHDFTKFPDYRIHWKLASSPTYDPNNVIDLAPTGITSYTATITGLEPNTTYTVQVRYFQGSTWISDSTVTATTGEATTPVPPASLEATATGSGTVDLAWTARTVAGKTISDYIVAWESTTPVDRGERTTGGTDATATVQGLRPGTEYTFYVRALFSDGSGSPPATATATTQAASAAPSKPTGLTATAAGETMIELAWAAAAGEGVTGYRIDSRTGSGDWTALVNDTADSYPGYVDIELEPGTEYEYRVKGLNAAGESPWSDTAKGTTDTYDAIAFRYEVPDKGVWFTPPARARQEFKMFMPEAYRPGASPPHGPYAYALTREDGSALPNWLRFDAATRTLTPAREPGPLDNAVKETITLKWAAEERNAPAVKASQTFTLYRCETEAHRRDIQACKESHPDNYNLPPEFTEQPTDQTATVGEPFTYEVPDATDFESDLIIYDATLANGSDLPTWLSGSGILTGTPGTDDAPAVLEIKLTVRDHLNTGDPAYFTLTVQEAEGAVGNANSPPAFTSGAADQTATEGELFSYTVPAATDPDKDTLTYTAALTDGNALPDWLSFAAGTRKFSGTPDADDAPAALDITVTATDDGEPPESGTTSFTLTVQEAGGAQGASNTAPAFRTAPADQTATEGKAFSYTVPAAVDAENQTLTYSAALTDGEALPDWLKFSGSSQTFSGTPGADDVTTELGIEVTATDDGEPPLSGSTTFGLSVKAANTAPTFGTAATDQTATVGEAFSYTAPAATDAENHALTYGAALTDGNALPDWLGFAAGTHAFSGTPGAGDVAAALGVTVTATDNGSPPLSGATSFALTVKGSPPTADAGSDVEGKRGEEGVVLDGSGTAHAKGSQSLTYQWEIAGASHSELEGLGSSLGGADSADATFTVPRRRDMTDRGAIDDGNWIDFELTVTDGDGESASDTMRLTIRGTTWQEIFASVADAEAEESSGSIDFVVTLDAAGRDPLSVDWATADGTATAGTDFTADSGTLTFAAGETSKTITVTLLDDAIDEGKETFALQLSNPQPPGTLMLDDAQATGTITNVDPLQTAWLARFGRAVATAAVDALGDRIERRAQARSGAGGTDADLSLLQSFFLSGAGGSGAAGYGGGPGPLGSGAPGHGMTGQDSGPGGAAMRSPVGGAGAPTGMVGQQHAGLGGMPMGGAVGGGMPMGGPPMRPDGSGPDYHLPAGSLFLPGGEGNRWTGWARTSTGHFSSLGGALPLQGQIRMGIFGADYELGRLLAGVAIAHGRGEGAMTAAELGRAYSAHSSLTSVHPYAAFDLAEDLTLWGQVGYGGGEMALVESHVRGAELEQAGAYRTGNSLAMAAVGARGALGEVGGFSLAAKSDAFVVRTTSDAVTAAGAGNLAAGAAGASRVRAALEASRALRFAGRSLTPSVELGIRQDGGDAETGLGLETGFGVVYSDPKLGLTVDATLNLLVAHQDSRYDEWGFSGSVRFDPGMAGRGLSLNVTPSFGSASQGGGRLWAMQDMGGLVPYGAVPFDRGGQFAAELGYGMAGPGGRGAGTPYAGLTRSGMGHRAMRYGYRWEVGQGFNVGVEGARQGGAGGFAQPVADGAGEQLGGAQHSVQVRGGVSF